MGTAKSRLSDRLYRMSRHIDQQTTTMTTSTVAHQMRNLKKVPAPPNITTTTGKIGNPAGKAALPQNTPAESHVPVPSPWSYSHLAANAGAPSIGRKCPLLERSASPSSSLLSWAFLSCAGFRSSSPTACMESVASCARSQKHCSNSFSGLATVTAL